MSVRRCAGGCLRARASTTSARPRRANTWTTASASARTTASSNRTSGCARITPTTPRSTTTAHTSVAGPTGTRGSRGPMSSWRARTTWRCCRRRTTRATSRLVAAGTCATRTGSVSDSPSRKGCAIWRTSERCGFRRAVPPTRWRTPSARARRWNYPERCAWCRPRTNFAAKRSNVRLISTGRAPRTRTPNASRARRGCTPTARTTRRGWITSGACGCERGWCAPTTSTGRGRTSPGSRSRERCARIGSTTTSSSNVRRISTEGTMRIRTRSASRARRVCTPTGRTPTARITRCACLSRKIWCATTTNTELGDRRARRPRRISHERCEPQPRGRWCSALRTSTARRPRTPTRSASRVRRTCTPTGRTTRGWSTGCACR